jgi:hypothetical protein
MDIGLVLEEGCEHHWGTAVSDTTSNTIQVPASYVLPVLLHGFFLMLTISFQ